MRKIVIIGAVLLIVLIGLFAIFSHHQTASKTAGTSKIPDPSPNLDPYVDYRAGFTIYTQGTRRIFTDSKYHNRSENAYLEAENPNIIVVKKNITWAEFFDTLPAPFKLENECLTTGTGQLFCTGQNGKLTFILNGKRSDDLLAKEIQDGDRLLVTFGSESERQINEQLQQIPDPQ